MKPYYLYIAILLAVILFSCSTTYRTSRQKTKHTFYRTPETVAGEEVKAFKDGDRYHSAYHTENPYYDGRNRILDGDIQGAIDILSTDINSMEYPNRAALWIFICKCKLGHQEEAINFLKEYVTPLSFDPDDRDVIQCMLLFYLGGLQEKKLIQRMRDWNDLENCSAYYYYGAYKKYYEEDYLTGNDYIARVLKTKITNFSEYKFAEMEIKGFTRRDPGQYRDFPISPTELEGAAFTLPIMEEKMPFTGGDVSPDDLKSVYDEFLSSAGQSEALQLVPEGLTDEQYVVPSASEDGWEVVSKEKLFTVFREEAVSMVDNLMLDTEYFMLEDEGTLEFYPQTNVLETYAVSFEDYQKDHASYEKKYGADYSSVSFILREGDFLAGVKIPCRVFDQTFQAFEEEEVMVTLNLLFTVNNDRTVELTHTFSRVLESE